MITTALAITTAVLAGVSLLLSGAGMILHALAPRTKTTLDDRAAAELDKLRADVDELRKLLPATDASRKPQTGRVRNSVLVGLAMFGLAAVIVASTLGCGAAQKQALKDLATCSETAAVQDLTPTVESILMSAVTGKISKESALAQLDGLGSSLGMDELACAVRAAQAFFATKQAGPSDTSAAAAKLAGEYLSGRGYK